MKLREVLNGIQGFNEVEAYCLYWKIFEKMHSDFCKISLTTEPVIHDFKLGHRITIKLILVHLCSLHIFDHKSPVYDFS